MDSITHALYKAVTAEDAHQRSVADAMVQGFGNGAPQEAGLRPLSSVAEVTEYPDHAPTDLFIELTEGPELLALQMELIAAGYCPPAGLYKAGADVIISPGRVEVFAPTDTGVSMWCATLEAFTSPDRNGNRRAGWQEGSL